jgi:hypothetical protein
MPYLYILKDETTSFIKIGKANDILLRIRNLRTANPNLNVVQTIECKHSNELETFLHNRFAHRRQRGEFFQVTTDEVEKEIHHALKVIQERPDTAILEATQFSLAQTSPRDASEKEVELLNRLLEVRADMAKLNLLETALLERIKVSIGNSSGLKDWATYKSTSREDIDVPRLKAEHPEIFEAYRRRTVFRQLRIRKFINFNADLTE